MNGVATLRVVSALEGASLLLLLFVAVPLKHFWGLPGAARVLGSLHGLLFLAFVSCLLQSGWERGWTRVRAAKLLLLSLVPFGALRIEQLIKDEAP